MKWDLDRNLFTQVGLDSGSLTMLGSVVHRFPEPGEYRGSVHKGEGKQAVFYVSVDKESPAGQVNVDLASLPEYSDASRTDCYQGCKESRFTVNPRGYVVFHVSGGSGGFSVHARRATEDPDEKVFNSQELGEGDLFATSIIRPGTYRAVNQVSGKEASVVVSYPEPGKTAYRPPAPVRVQVGRKGFEPGRVELKPGQGLVFEVKAPARIVISLAKADDGPRSRPKAPPRGWTRPPKLAEAGKEAAKEAAPGKRKTAARSPGKKK